MIENMVTSPDPAAWKKGQHFRALSAPAGEEKTYLLERLLGGGLTSLVWKASELNKDEKTVLTLALKVLRPNPTEEFLKAFRTEFEILQRFKSLAVKREISDYPAPLLFDWSPNGAEPMFMAMELAPGKDINSWVTRSSSLPAEVQEITRQADEFLVRLRTFDAYVHAEEDVKSSLKEETDNLVAGAATWRQQLSQVQVGLEGIESKQKSLEEEELLKVGVVASQILQDLNAVIRRSYLDFQLKNIFYERETGRVKVIDWNIVTEEGDIRPQEDIFKLAAGFFYIFTHVELKNPITRIELQEKGGRAWQVGLSAALRLVLERALLQNPPHPYKLAWSEVSMDGLKLLSEIDSFGGALDMLLRYSRAGTLDFMALMDRCKQEGRVEELLAIYPYARNGLQHADDYLRANLEKGLEEIYQQAMADRLSIETRLTEARNWLRANDRQKAFQNVQEVLKLDPRNLEAHRLSALLETVKDMTFIEFGSLWQNGALQAGLDALAERRWERALQAFGRAARVPPALLADADLNRQYGRVQDSFRLFLSVDDPMAGDAFSESVDALQKLLEQKQPEYYELIMQEWPDLQEWRRQTELYRQLITDRAKTIDSVGKGFLE